MKKIDLNTTEFDPYYKIYIDKVSEKTTLRKGFEEGKKAVLDFFKSIPEEKFRYRYQPEKWSTKEVLQHLIDTERIFMYRCFRMARHDKTALAGYDQDDYITPSGADQKSIANLLEEFTTNRNHSISLLHSLSDENLSFVGTSSGGAMSGRAAAFTVLGHDIWHIEVIQNKYL